MFAPNSRYAGLTTYTVTMPDGSTVISDAPAAAQSAAARRLPSPHHR